MKFITEEDLRDLYRKEPFTAYEPEPGARLTPGARQFLADRGINMFDMDFGGERKAANIKPAGESPGNKNNWKNTKLQCQLKSIEALFLLTEEELLHRDVCLAQSLIKLGKQFSDIRKAVKCKGTVDNLACHECTGIKGESFSTAMEDCFEITEFHIQLEKGREILLLHRLRCSLQEVEPAVMELCTGNSEDTALYVEMAGKVNQIVNSLSQLICAAFGGKTCQRQG